MGDAHAAPAAAGRRLHQHGVADLVGDAQGLVLALERGRGAGNRINLGLAGDILRLDLIADAPHRLHVRADELDVA